MKLQEQQLVSNLNFEVEGGSLASRAFVEKSLVNLDNLLGL